MGDVLSTAGRTAGDLEQTSFAAGSAAMVTHDQKAVGQSQMTLPTASAAPAGAVGICSTAGRTSTVDYVGQNSGASFRVQAFTEVGPPSTTATGSAPTCRAGQGGGAFFRVQVFAGAKGSTATEGSTPIGGNLKPDPPSANADLELAVRASSRELRCSTS